MGYILPDCNVLLIWQLQLANCEGSYGKCAFGSLGLVDEASPENTAGGTPALERSIEKRIFSPAPTLDVKGFCSQPSEQCGGARAGRKNPPTHTQNTYTLNGRREGYFAQYGSVLCYWGNKRPKTKASVFGEGKKNGEIAGIFWQERKQPTHTPAAFRQLQLGETGKRPAAPCMAFSHF